MNALGHVYKDLVKDDTWGLDNLGELQARGRTYTLSLILTQIDAT